MEGLSMPSIVYIYLFINIAVTLYAYKYCYFKISSYGEIIEGFSVTGVSVLLVLAYYYPEISDFFGVYIFILVILGSAYHIKYRDSYIYESDEPVDNLKEAQFHKYFNIVLITVNLILIVPAYIYGMLSGVRYV